ncbi:MAG: hypothetical protein HYR90_00580, partial [Candidatus Andersenbacteria bacterium]|nr:hypothetical protein [Candidatus Andersenbacteria bacterium]
MEVFSLERVIYQTIRYFDIFNLPVTTTQIWWCLVTEQHTGLRWGGHRQYALADIQRELQESSYLKENTGTTYGYYFLKGKEQLVRERLRRHSLAQDKWKIAKWCARFLAAMPFVRGLAGSGSLALDNTNESSDLDFLVIAHPNRIWTTRLGLLLVSQLLGRRRKYWDRQAPDKLCLNHYVAASRLHLPAALHNLYNAVQYRHLVPVYARSVVKDFQEENIGW